ncbi:hypothetical protein DY467_02730 [Rhodopseudomonas sp. BR0G17]|nr:hypothetical protein [Rhodopseudomonas sp. BR0G17]
MTAEIGRWLAKIEASIRGNIEFVVTVHDGEEMDLAFGPQIRRMLTTAELWIDRPIPDVRAALDIAQASLSQFCADARPTELMRDSDVGKLLRDFSDFDPRYEIAADMMREIVREVDPEDETLLRELQDYVQGSRARIDKLLVDYPDAEATLAPLNQMSDEVTSAIERIESYVSRRWNPPPPQLDRVRMLGVARQLDDVETVIRQTLDFDDSCGDLLEAMALAFWKERWRLYELWLLCATCDQLAQACDRIDALGRVSDGKWRLRFTRDATPVLICEFGEEAIEVFYQYFETGKHRANMPDIALRRRSTGDWLAIVDPKMGLTYRQRELEEVCLRYADAFQAQVSIVANYFPDRPRTERLAHRSQALICHGLRPSCASPIRTAIAEAVVSAGVQLRTKRVVVLVDVSGSTEACQTEIQEAVGRALRADAEIDLGGSVVACFSDRWIEHMSAASFERLPHLPSAAGGTNPRSAYAQAAQILTDAPGPKEIWLFGDGQDADAFDVDAMQDHGIAVRAYLCTTIVPSSLERQCVATGGSAITFA